MQIIEAVPNFSTSDPLILESISSVIREVPEIAILNKSSDSDHNRSVITFIGTPKSILEASFFAISKASELIDMNLHSGVHPYIGACDVMPFVPIANTKMKDCVELAKTLGEKVAKELEIPVYLYEYASTKPKNKNLANIREGRLVKLKDEIKNNPERQPDFGPLEIGSAGAIAIGARNILVAFNVNLKQCHSKSNEESQALKAVKQIAKKMRQKNGGLPSVKAIGFKLQKQNCVQVSMNLTDFRVSSPKIVFDKIAELALQYDLEIIESELIGLIPQAATFEGFEKYLKLKDFNNLRILEYAIAHSSLMSKHLI